MEYGKNFSCIDVYGKRTGPHYPKLMGFKYEDGDDGWYLLEDFSIEYKGVIYTVKAGFDFDGASIPKAVWSIIGHPLMLNIQVAALFHDILYCTHIMSRSETDMLFLEVQEAYGCTWAKRNTTYSAVRAFGWKPWPKTKEEIDKYTPFLKTQCV